MRLVIFEDDQTDHFAPLHWLHAVFELRCGATTLAAKIEQSGAGPAVALITRPDLAALVRERTGKPVNELAGVTDDDTLFVNGRVSGHAFSLPEPGVALWRGETLACWRASGDVASIDSYAALAAGAAGGARGEYQGPWFDYIWDLVKQNAAQLTADFDAAGRVGVHGQVHASAEVFGPTERLFIGDGAEVHPFVCIDTREGPVTIEAGVEIHPYTRIEGPCYVGPGTILLGAKIREGCSIGPMCRVGGEVEESIIHGCSNKYHDGFLGHAYVGEWVNLGALTTNSDLKNDYTNVVVSLGGKPIDTGTNKIGSFIGDHVKTSIGTLLNTGSVVGTLAVLVATGAPLPKTIPAGAWFMGGAVTKGFGLNPLIDTARQAMSRRKQPLTATHEARLREVYAMTTAERDRYVQRARQALVTR